MNGPVDRRRFLTAGVVAGAATAVGASRSAEARVIRGEVPWAPRQADAPHPITGPSYVYFTQGEAAFVESATERLIPADELGPGALQCDVPLFIDHQLAGAYGRAQSWYMQGPWADGTDTQGFQSRLDPAAMYRAAIKAVDAHVAKTQHGKSFAKLAPEAQDAVLHDLESGKLELDGGDAKAFFKLLLMNTKEGMFADPIYGGNREMAAWKMIGFPGAHYDYTDWVGRHGERCTVPPVGIRGRPGWTPQG